MRAGHPLVIVLLTLSLLAACGSETADNGDPGEPALMYGTKAGGELYLGDREVGYVFFTFLAPDEPNRARFFARPDNLASRGVQSYYMSLVFDDEPWRVGGYQQAIGGRVEFVLADGSRYAADASELVLSATITRTSANEGGHYPVGRLNLQVPAASPGDEPLEARLSIGNPDVGE